MRYLLLFFLLSKIALGGTCTSITRSDFVDGNILSASDLNGQFAPAYASINAADGGCVTDGTLELAALDTGEYAPHLKGIKAGCAVNIEAISEFTDATSSFVISKCVATVDGKSVNKIATSSVTYANLDTGTIATATTYYVYITTGSTGSTLTPKISVTAPDASGYNTSGDLVLARFQTNTSTNTYRKGSLYQWLNNLYKSQNVVTESFVFRSTTGALTDAYGGLVLEGTKTATGTYGYTVNANYAKSYNCTGNVGPGYGGLEVPSDRFAWIGYSSYAIFDLSDAALADDNLYMTCTVFLK